MPIVNIFFIVLFIFYCSTTDLRLLPHILLCGNIKKELIKITKIALYWSLIKHMLSQNLNLLFYIFFIFNCYRFGTLLQPAETRVRTSARSHLPVLLHVQCHHELHPDHGLHQHPNSNRLGLHRNGPGKKNKSCNVFIIIHVNNITHPNSPQMPSA